MNETQFNAELRAVLRAQGLRALHIREADQPGPTDLVIWQGRSILAWAELKVYPHDTDPQQDQFIREREAEGGNAYVITLTGSGLVNVQILNPDWPEQYMTLTCDMDFRLNKWRNFFLTHNRIVEQS